MIYSVGFAVANVSSYVKSILDRQLQSEVMCLLKMVGCFLGYLEVFFYSFCAVELLVHYMGLI
uniref:Uncharacterized protein n=1 Tax=Arundo donax TaxID=35708 RepID=A0A0A8ZVW3_ARUDO